METIRYPSVEAEKRIKRVTGRGLKISDKAYEAVTNILSDVQNRGDDAVIDYTRQFDSRRAHSCSAECKPP